MPLSDARERDDAADPVAAETPTSAKRHENGADVQPTGWERIPVPAGVWQLADRWLRRCLEVVTESAPALDTLNVFPVADADTGTNLCLTLRAVDRAVDRLDAGTTGQVAATAIRSAHGNSGAIVAEMLSAAARFQPSNDTGPAQLLADLVQASTDGATQAVARPTEGTILSVARAAAASVAEAVPDGPLAVAQAARDAAAAALADTVDQLPALQHAGVVDAGGQAYVLLLDVLVEVLGGAEAQALAAPAPPRPGHATVPAGTGTADDEYEVMYTVRGADHDALTSLRGVLDSVGNSVVVVGDQTVAQVHVHLADAGSAIQPALAIGELSQIKITTLRASDPPRPRRTVISLVAGRGLADAVESGGGTAVPVTSAPQGAAALTDLLAADTAEVIILPNDMEQLEIALVLGREATGDGRRVAAVPTVAQAQGLAALAVHDAAADFDDAIAAMTAAAQATRHGAITVAEAPVSTMVGRCSAGDVLGVVDGDITHVGSDLADLGWHVIAGLIGDHGASGSTHAGPSPDPPAGLLTLIIGAQGSVDLAHDLAERARSSYPGLEVQVLFGGQDRYHLLIGVE